MMKPGARVLFAAALLSATAMAAAQVPDRSSLPVAERGFQGTVGETFRTSSPATPHQPVRAPVSAPNILVILLDDAGFGQYATFGGAIPSPAIETLARDGLRYNRFHTVGICSPTRAALLTGRNSHNAGVGIVTELSTGYDGYTGVIPQTTAPVARILRDNGYATAMFGKNHNTPSAQSGAGGPYAHWPNAFGFDYFYGFNAWGTSQFQPLLFENNRAILPTGNPEYQLTHDLTDRAIAWIHQAKSADPGRPWFLYMATGATHAPHHAPKDWIDRFKGQFDQGWDRYREQVFARQKKAGVIPGDAKLTPRPAEIPAWSSLSPEQQRINARQMEVFAGFAAYTDAEMKRLVDAVRAMPEGENTLIVYIAGDNGASAEGAANGTLNEIATANGLKNEAQVTLAQLDDLGSARYNNNYPAGWGWAVNTPFRYYKQVVSHLGAIRNPLVISWPARIRATGEVRPQFADVTDIAPTLLEAAGVPVPGHVDGFAQKPMDGVSLAPTFDDKKAAEVRTRQYFEVFGNRAIYDGGWMASAKLADPWEVNRIALDPDKVSWELYDLSRDFTQSRDVAARHPEKLAELKATFDSEARRNNVYPLDWRAGERLADLQAPSRQTSFTFYPGLAGLPEAAAPVIRNRSWTIRAIGTFTPDDDGVLITQGGMSGGWTLRMAAGRLVYDYNLGGVDQFTVTSDQPVPAGSNSLTVRFSYAGAAGARGQGGEVRLFAGDQQIGAGQLPRTLSGLFAINEGLDIGADYGSPAGDYPLPSRFTGQLEKVTLDLD